MSIVTDYKIAKTTGTCGCGHAFTEGESFVTALFENGESLERRDTCTACWNEPQEAYSYWHSRALRKDEKKRENPVAVVPCSSARVRKG